MPWGCGTLPNIDKFCWTNACEAFWQEFRNTKLSHRDVHFYGKNLIIDITCAWLLRAWVLLARGHRLIKPANIKYTSSIDRLEELSWEIIEDKLYTILTGERRLSQVQWF